ELGTGDVFPYVLLLVSGGHCQLVAVRGVGNYELLGTTLDDAVGECFDKVGKMLGLPHPAGPALDVLSLTGNAGAVVLPTPKNDQTLDFSFSGLKTAVRTVLEKSPEVKHEDVAAAFTDVVVRVMVKKVGLALDAVPEAKALVAAGGVACNKALRAALADVAAARGVDFAVPAMRYCTDNAVMIGWCAGLRAVAGFDDANLGVGVRPRWPLGEDF
ncbi:MAG: tRNA (adenosine(37)-N6)-threonylcarbamoyltransferase complex transferase subunit TsaD, partial [Alphaproteobacteria bacterium CG_4_10_14_0_8_um_filter_53_9]